MVLGAGIIHNDRTTSFQTARALKKMKYQPVVDILKQKCCNVVADAVIIEGIGSWDKQNDKAMARLCSQKYLLVLKKLAVSDVIAWGCRVYNQHLTDIPQYVEEDVVRIILIHPNRRNTADRGIKEPLVDRVM